MGSEVGIDSKMAANSTRVPYCCFIPCDLDAEYMVVYGVNPMPDDYSDACADHLGHLIGLDQTPATVYHVEERLPPPDQPTQ